MKQLGFQPELEVWTVWTRSGRSGHGLRCLEPGQKFRKFNSDHFPFFKNLYRTFGSRVSLPWLEIGSGRSGNGLRCLEPGQKGTPKTEYQKYRKIQILVDSGAAENVLPPRLIARL